MRAGRRNKRVLIERPIEATNEYGEKIITWIDLATVWARVAPMRGKEYFSEQQTNNENIITITISYLSGMSDKYRIFYNSKYFEIRNIINIEEKNVDLELMCSEIT